VYARRVGRRELTFVVSGKLWNRSLVMMDKETGSLWSHLLGEAMRGPLKGTELETVPSIITDWATWRRDHPKTTVLAMSRTAERFQSRLVSRQPEKYVLGMAGGEAKAWPLDQLKKQPVVNDTFDGVPILIVFDASTGTAWSYERRVDGKSLDFTMRRDGIVVDRETGSTWHFARGAATAGPLKGTSLTPALGIVSYRRAWEQFHPHTKYWQP